jgi:hypothetical protein
VPPGTRAAPFAVSADTLWIAAPVIPQNSQIELFSPATATRTVLDLPFVMTGSPEFIPGANSLLALGGKSLRSPGNLRDDTIVRIYRVPLNGDTPSLLADAGVLPRWSGTFLSTSVSPDGKSVVYSVQPESSTQTLGMIDLRGVIPGSPSRAPRR